MFDELLENMFDELKEVKYFEEITAFRSEVVWRDYSFQECYNVKTLKK